MSQVDSGQILVDEARNTVAAGIQSTGGSTVDAGEAAAAARGEPASASMLRMEQAWREAMSEIGSGGGGAAGDGPLDIDSVWNDALREARSLDASGQFFDSALNRPVVPTAAGAVDDAGYTFRPDNTVAAETDRILADAANDAERAQRETEREAELMARGRAAFRDGRLDDALECYEAVVTARDDNAEAWRMLGQCHAENDEDRRAIACLERAAERDPYNLEALVALGVSRVNELDQDGALRALRAWIKHNPTFAGLEVTEDPFSDGTETDEVMQLMLKARAHDPTDAHVPEVLGVLYNVSRDYDSAIACFESALERRPDDHGLWNKLGATRANSSRSEAAMPAYHRALEIKPRYARGWLNLGIAHANVGSYGEAARCYLTALALNQGAQHIWSYLRIAFTCVERFDLAAKCSKQDVSLFADEYDIPFGKGAK
jgi:peroxin-5